MREYTRSDTAFAWLCLAIGYAFCRVFPASYMPMGALLFIIGLFLIATVILSFKKIRFDILPVTVALSAIIMAFSMIFSSNSFIHFFAYAYSLAAFCYFVYASLGNRSGRGLTDMTVLDIVKAVFVAPFLSLEDLIKTLIYGKNRFNGKLIVRIGIGIAAALVPGILIVALLSYDSDFLNLIINILNSIGITKILAHNSIGITKILAHIGSFILGIPVAELIYSLYISSIDRKAKNIMTPEKCRDFSEKLRIAPVATVISAVVPILAVYVLFFISQWKYYVSGFIGVLPDRISYSNYAREGFFQLCAVAVINLVIVIAISLLLRRKEGRITVTQRVLSVILSAFTLVLIATAVAKMLMYIDCFGLTPKRLYASWLMAVIALVFVMVILRQFVQHIPVVALSFVTLTAAFMMLSFANTDAVIANHNVDGYIEGEYESVDLDLLTHLGDSAVPALARYATYCEEEYGRYSDEYNEARAAVFEAHDFSDSGIFSFTLPHRTAADIIYNLS